MSITYSVYFSIINTRVHTLITFLWLEIKPFKRCMYAMCMCSHTHTHTHTLSFMPFKKCLNYQGILSSQFLSSCNFKVQTYHLRIGSNPYPERQSNLFQTHSSDWLGLEAEFPDFQPVIILSHYKECFLEAQFLHFPDLFSNKKDYPEGFLGWEKP